MKITKRFLTHNDCYKEYRKIKPCGIMVHSTGADNPHIDRYTTAANGWNRPGVQKCVHFFIGLEDDGEVACHQTLPLDCMGWHSGSGSQGWRTNANNRGYLGFEICEDDLSDRGYFESVYREAVALCVYLCKMYGWDPLEDGRLICHAEGHKRGIASNHGDVLHWWPKFGKDMDTFRAAVAEAMKPEDKPKEDEDMITQEDFNKMMDNWLAEQAKKPASGWAERFVAEAVERGITADGSRPQSFITRQEAMTMVVSGTKEKA